MDEPQVASNREQCKSPGINCATYERKHAGHLFAVCIVSSSQSKNEYEGVMLANGTQRPK